MPRPPLPRHPAPHAVGSAAGLACLGVVLALVAAPRPALAQDATATTNSTEGAAAPQGDEPHLTLSEHPTQPDPDLTLTEGSGGGSGIDPGLHGDDGDDDEELAGEVAIVEGTQRPMTREEMRAQEERRLDEEADALPPPPPPEWRLRAGIGVGLPLNGANVPYMRVHQEIEWQPTGAAPFIFGLGGSEYLLGGVLGSAGARIGMATDFCQDAVVRCQGAVNVVLGAFFGSGLLAFDAGGEGDVRFLFGALELSVRVGFGGGGGINMLYGSGGIGAAF